MENSKELLDAQTHIWNTIFAYHKSMALKCAVELKIPDTIHNNKKPMTLQNLANALAIPPTKTPSLHRLLRLLVHSNFFTITHSPPPSSEELYNINQNSRLLLTTHPCTLAPFTLGILDPIMTTPPHHLTAWFQNQDESVFHVVHGKSFWEYASLDDDLNGRFNLAMASDAGLVSSLLLGNEEFKGMIEGVGTLVDVAGGDGTLCKAIAEAYPEIKCVVFDLPHVVGALEGGGGDGGNLEFVAGDMFVHITPADALILKWILHDWSDEHCIKILERCKEAIPKTGKIIIIDMVVKPQSEEDLVPQLNAQLLLDMEMMALTVGGKERTENQWKVLFDQAGFHRYKIFPILGVRSVIQVSRF